MKYQYVREVAEPVRTYEGKMVSTGDVVDFESDWICQKASNNPNFQRYAEVDIDPGVEPGDIEATGEKSIEEIRGILFAAGVTIDGRWGEKRLRKEAAKLGD